MVDRPSSRITLHHADCIEAMRGMPDSSVDAVVTDPPYGLEFMGKEWDGADGFRRSLNLADAGRDSVFGRSSRTSPEYRAGHLFQEWTEAWAREALRVLKPGGHLLAFGGSRTYHRLAVAVEDAGFEIRDQIMWVYGSGFPKSLDVSKAIDKAAGAVREVVGEHPGAADRRPRNSGSRAGGILPGVSEITAPATDAARQWDGWGTALKPAHEPIVMARKPLVGTVAANVLKHGAGALNIDGCRVAHASADDLAVSLSKNPGTTETVTSDVYGASRQQQSVNTSGRWPANFIHDDSDEVLELFPVSKDSGSSARFFYTAKASKSERWEYLICNCEAGTLSAWENEDQNQSVPTGCTSPQKDIYGETLTGGYSSPMSPHGSESTGEFPLGSKSTTSTRTSRTTASKTCDSSALLSTNESTQAANCETGNGGNRADSAGDSSRSLKSTGISRKNTGRSMGGAVPATLPKSSPARKCDACGQNRDAVGHPTVKPLALMRYLCRLVTPPGGVVLDPFMGSGTTGCAAKTEGFGFIGIEREEAYHAIARGRIDGAQRIDTECRQGSLFEEVRPHDSK